MDLSAIFFLIIVVIIAIVSYIVYRNYSFNDSGIQEIIGPSISASIKEGTFLNSKLPSLNVGENNRVYSYNVWLQINDVTSDEKSTKHIFHKGTEPTEGIAPNINIVDMQPGVFLGGVEKNIATLRVYSSSFRTGTNNRYCEISIPTGKFFMLSIVMNGNGLKVYINGGEWKGKIVDGVGNCGMIFDDESDTSKEKQRWTPRTNQSDIYYLYKGGFDGYISDMTYFSKELTQSKIDELHRNGPTIDDSYKGPSKSGKVQYNKLAGNDPDESS
jgi:hypothetical protein